MPTGNDTTQRDDTKLTFSNDLFEQMLHPVNFQQAWIPVRANEGAPGIDGMTVEDFPDEPRLGRQHAVPAVQNQSIPKRLD